LEALIANSWALGVSLVLFLGFWSLGKVILYQGLSRQTTLPFVALSIGLLLFTFCLVLLQYLEQSWHWALLLFIPGMVLQIRGIFLKKWVLVLLIVFLFLGLPYLISGYYMGKNPHFAEVYFAVDTPFTLMLAKSFLQGSGYPPMLLDNLGQSLPYHFGFHQLLAFWSSITAWPVHRVFATILMPFLLFLKFGLIFQCLKELANVQSKQALLAAIFVYFATNQYLFNYLNPQTVFNLITLPGRYHASYPLGPSTVGPLFLFITFFLLSKYNYRSWGLAAILIALIPIFKIPYAPAMGLGFGLFALVMAIIKRNWRWVIFPAVGGSAMLAVYMTFSATIAPESMPVQLFKATHVLKDHIFSSAIALILLLGFWLYNKSFKEDIWQVLNLLLIAIPLPILLQFVAIQDHNAWQLISLSALAAWFALAFILAKNWTRFQKRMRQITFAMGLGLIAIPVANTIFYIQILIKSPEQGHDFCDNRMLAQTLSKIPVEGALLATNDLRYPADLYHRPDAQLQFAALFGHQMFVSNLHYLSASGFSAIGKTFQSQLPTSLPPTPDEFDFLISKGITHYIHAVIDSTQSHYPVKAYRTLDLTKTKHSTEIYENRSL
jgi:hypothetical protein